MKLPGILATLILGLLLTLPARLPADIGSDVTFSTLFPYETSFHTYNYIFLGTDAFAIGGVVQYAQPHYYLQDIVYSGAMRIGFSDYLVELSGGVFNRTMEGITQNGEKEKRSGQGFSGTILLGQKFGKYFRITLPLTFKRIDQQQEDDDLSKRWNVEISPFIGVRFF